jgi:type II secretory pathway pseudopilin PulG
MKSRGFTLVEAIVYLAILIIIVGAVVNLLLFVFRSNVAVQATREVEANVQIVMDQFAKEIRAAGSIYTPTTSASQLSLETTNSLPAGETSTYIDFFLCGTRVCVKRESQLPQALTSEEVEITSLQFTEVRTGAISSFHIALDIEYVNPGNKPERDASMSTTTTISMRAY